jgi:hypothetical protein
MFFHCLFINFLVGRSTLFCWLMAFAHWAMSSLLTLFKHTWYHGQFFFMG